MTIIARSSWMPILLCLAAPAMAQHHHGHNMGSGSFASMGGGGSPGPVIVGGGPGPVAGGGGFGPVASSGHHPGRGSNQVYGLGAVGSGFGYGYNSFGYGVPFNYYPQPLVLAMPVVPTGFGNGGLMLPKPPPSLIGATGTQARRPNPARAKEHLEIGDRSFRGGNIKRAEEKYHLAIKADPTSPIPHVHLAQVSLARGDYAAAADHLRDAVTVAGDPGWLLNTADIQSIYGEPADFAKKLALLETHLQAQPGDRDAWFVLGAEYYLSGRSKLASDVFQRLTDRRADEALAAFIDASNPRPRDAAN